MQDVNGGLCWSCKNSETCRYVPKKGENMICCEEYSSGKVKRYFDTDQDIQQVSPFQEPEQDQSGNGFKALCKDCGKMKSCTLPMHLAGAWECEEYR